MSTVTDESKSRDKAIDDTELEKLAVEELLREAVAGAARAELVGPSGWVKGPHTRTNKKFLTNTIRHALASNRYHQLNRDRFKPYRQSVDRDPSQEHPSSDKYNRGRSKH